MIQGTKGLDWFWRRDCDSEMSSTRTGAGRGTRPALRGGTQFHQRRYQGGDIGRQNLKCLATYGTMIVYGSASHEDFHISAWGLLANIHTVKVYYLTLDSPNNRAQYAKELMEHIKAGRLQVMVTEFPLAQAADAHRAIEGRTTMGKVVLAIK
jgi:Zinc-binding dehydrogenase